MELPRPSLVRTAAAVRIPTRLLTGTSSSPTFFAAALCTRYRQSLAGRRSRAQMAIPVYLILRVFWEYVLRVCTLVLGVLLVPAEY